MGCAVKALSAPPQDELGGTIRIFFDLAVPQSKNGPAQAFQESRAFAIVSRRGLGMLTTVQFDS